MFFHFAKDDRLVTVCSLDHGLVFCTYYLTFRIWSPSWSNPEITVVICACIDSLVEACGSACGSTPQAGAEALRGDLFSVHFSFSLSIFVFIFVDEITSRISSAKRGRKTRVARVTKKHWTRRYREVVDGLIITFRYFLQVFCLTYFFLRRTTSIWEVTLCKTKYFSTSTDFHISSADSLRRGSDEGIPEVLLLSDRDACLD